ncbi:MAG: putative heme transporter, partial [Acidimicrobiaceae bacterium]
RRAMRSHKRLVVLTSMGHALGDYVALYASLLAVGLRPSPAMVLVAFTAANAAGMIPVTPGGLGFVEAGLSGTLVLMGAGEEQTLAAVAIYRLMSCWLPALAGIVAYVSSRRSAPMAPVTRTSASTVIENTCLGVPAAAQTVS